VAVAQKVYDFPLEKVEDQLVSYLKKQRGESTVADMIAGTGLPKYQVEQAAKAALDEYAGRLKVTESGELLYYFPNGMRSTVNGAGPSLKRFWKAFKGTAARVLKLLFKIWIVATLVGYFVLFAALAVLAILASVAASMAGKGDGRDSGRDRGGGFGGMFLVMRLFDLIIRMWFWSSILKDPRSKRPKEGRAFYKSVFGFVFGDGDPNFEWDEAERKYCIAYILSRKGVITVEELMALTGREYDAAHALMNRLLLEYEGEPGVTNDGTVVYSFPELMRTADVAHKAAGQVPVLNPSAKTVVPFSANKPRTNGWIIFFNAFNLAFGTALSKTGPYLYSFVGRLLLQAGLFPAEIVSALAVVLGIIPVAFSVFFFLVPLFRRIRLGKQNDAIREETLRRRVMAHVLASPARVDPGELRPIGTNLDPRDLPATSRRVLEKIAAALKAEPIPLEKEGLFAYRFPELERELADLEAFRRGIDTKRYEVGKTVFDSGQ
jgi:hypothetical protein